MDSQDGLKISRTVAAELYVWIDRTAAARTFVEMMILLPSVDTREMEFDSNPSPGRNCMSINAHSQFRSRLHRVVGEGGWERGRVTDIK